MDASAVNTIRSTDSSDSAADARILNLRTVFESKLLQLKRLPELSTLLDGSFSECADLDPVLDSLDFGSQEDRCPQAAQRERPRNKRTGKSYEEMTEPKLDAVCNNSKEIGNVSSDESTMEPTTGQESTYSCHTSVSDGTAIQRTTPKELVHDPDLVTSPISVEINTEEPEPNTDAARIRIVSVESLCPHYKITSPNYCTVTNTIQRTPASMVLSEAALLGRTGTASEVFTTWSSTHWSPVTYATQSTTALSPVIVHPPGLILTQRFYQALPLPFASAAAISRPVYITTPKSCILNDITTVTVPSADIRVHLVGQRVSGARKRKMSAVKTFPKMSAVKTFPAVPRRLYPRLGDNVTLEPVVPAKKSKAD